jgi:hypothetical protein
MPASMPASIPQAVQQVAEAMPLLETSLEAGAALDLIEAVRGDWLDAVVVSLPAPTDGLRITPLRDQHAVLAVPIRHDQAVRSEIRLGQLAPERILTLPREANRPLYDAVVASCRAAGLAPELIEMPDAQIEHALLAVTSGAGLALLPECLAERYRTPGVRFIPLGDESATFATAVLSRRSTEHIPTVAFLRTITTLADMRAAGESEYPLGDADHRRIALQRDGETGALISERTGGRA